MATASAAPVAETRTDEARLIRLPLGLADFERRGFRNGRPERRQVLETHARSFLTGFNIAAKHWRDPHSALAKIPEAERGFAYEGAGMHAGFRSLHRRGNGPAFQRLCRGAGDRYIHLIHVGFGWAGAMARLPIATTIPSTPLLRWLALDGAGFARVYFGGQRQLGKMWSHAPGGLNDAMLAGAGRALWFHECADVDHVAEVIGAAPHRSRSELWAGVGLATCYAGCADTAAINALMRSAGDHGSAFAQGVLFAGAARARSGHVPDHTARTCDYLFRFDTAEAADWTDRAAHGLTDLTTIAAYTEWKARLRRAIATRL